VTETSVPGGERSPLHQLHFRRSAPHVFSITIYILAVVFLAALIRSTFSFGEALAAVPLLALRIPIQVTVPLAVLLSIMIAAIVVAQD
jgi:hypothetical protein